MKPVAYGGMNQDLEGGMTHLGRIVKDAWVFGLLPETEDCTGWSLDRMQVLSDQVAQHWERYGHLPSRLPEDLRQRHLVIHQDAILRARSLGWDPTLGDED